MKYSLLMFLALGSIFASSRARAQSPVDDFVKAMETTDRTSVPEELFVNLEAVPADEFEGHTLKQAALNALQLRIEGDAPRVGSDPAALVQKDLLRLRCLVTFARLGGDQRAVVRATTKLAASSFGILDNSLDPIAASLEPSAAARRKEGTSCATAGEIYSPILQALEQMEPGRAVNLILQMSLSPHVDTVGTQLKEDGNARDQVRLVLARRLGELGTDLSGGELKVSLRNKLEKQHDLISSAGSRLGFGDLPSRPSTPPAQSEAPKPKKPASAPKPKANTLESMVSEFFAKAPAGSVERLVALAQLAYSRGIALEVRGVAEEALEGAYAGLVGQDHSSKGLGAQAAALTALFNLDLPAPFRERISSDLARVFQRMGNRRTTAASHAAFCNGLLERGSHLAK